MTYKNLATRPHLTSTPQTKQSDPRQVKNAAGGYVFTISDEDLLRRFLILGTTAGTYYVNGTKHTADTFEKLRGVLDRLGARFVDIVVEVSDGGLAPKNDEAILMLALATSAEDPVVRKYALDALPKVVRIGTHMFQFSTFVQQFRGNGPALMKAMRRWYTDRSPESLAYQLVKYQRRNGVSTKTVLGVVRPKPKNPEQGVAFEWAVGKRGDQKTGLRAIDGYIAAHTEGADIPALVREFGLTHEMLPSQSLSDPAVWVALVEKMGLTALIRNLGRLTKLGVLDDRAIRADVISRITDHESIRAARVHPIAFLFALTAYKSGAGRSGTEWTPIPSIIDALDKGFVEAFVNVESTGKRRLIALDVSGSMGIEFIANSKLSARDASAALTKIALTVDDCDVIAFTSGDRRTHRDAVAPLTISANQRLDDIIDDISDLPFGHTNCALPFEWALENDRVYDSVEVYTDCETWGGNQHVHEALAKYRRKTGVNTKLIVVGMTATDASIADPNDPDSLDVVGFDASAPAAISRFISA
jgi:60 kDa SS-A/Ro ribonucleoprotein